MLLFILSVAILLLTSLLFVSLLKLSSKTDWLLVFFLFGFSNIILVFSILNLFEQINQPYLILLVQHIFLLAGFVIWYRSDKPDLFLPFRTLQGFWNDLKKNRSWIVTALVVIILLNLVFNVILILVVPPNNNDALSIHLARVGMWNQNGSILPWDASRVWQVTFPPNAQFVYLWTLVFTHNDHLMTFFPLLTALITMAAIYRFSMHLMKKRWAAIFISLLWLTLPVIQLHLTSIRHDLVSTALFITAFYFLYFSSSKNRTLFLRLSALSIAIAIGTNMSIAAYLPGFVIVALLMWLVFKRLSFRDLSVWASAALIFFLIFGAQIYMINTFVYGAPLGPDAESMTVQEVLKETSLINYLGTNTVRWLYQMLDFSGLPQPLMGYAIKAKAYSSRYLFNTLGWQIEGDIATLADHSFDFKTVYDYQEDEAWFGPIGAFLLLGLVVFEVIRGIRQKSLLKISIGVFFFSMLLTAAIIRPGWTPYDGRYFMPISALAMCLLMGLFANIKYEKLIQGILLILGVIVMFNSVMNNPAKPLTGARNIWVLDRLGKITLQSHASEGMLLLVEGYVPEDASIAVAAPGNDYAEYAIYGQRFMRTVIPVVPSERLYDDHWLEEADADYLLIWVSDSYPEEWPQTYDYLDSYESWIILEAVD